MIDAEMQGESREFLGLLVGEDFPPRWALLSSEIPLCISTPILFPRVAGFIPPTQAFSVGEQCGDSAR